MGGGRWQRWMGPLTAMVSHEWSWRLPLLHSEPATSYWYVTFTGGLVSLGLCFVIYKVE